MKFYWSLLPQSKINMVILGTFSMAKIEERDANLNSLLNRMPPINRLVNYAWYPGTVQLHKTQMLVTHFLM